MPKYLLILLLCLVTVNCQSWGSRACLVNSNGYYFNIIQNAINKLENNIKWCNLKVNDVNQEIDERLFKWHAQGTANYTNGFLLHFRNIDVSNIQTTFSTRTVNGTVENTVTSNGLLNFRNVYIGYDVVADIEGFDTQHFTGVFSYNLITLRCMIVRNLQTDEISVTTTSASSSAAARRMTYMPENTISELLSRHFFAYHISFSEWGPNYITPIVLEAASKTELPEIRYDNKC
ncbi:uncharacterized protein LOC124531961 [Vanessa cardui]|uniref:uncharacterized protein LOC124531961 n=1 Tax=Vanessa cardui TaxID=171605 RepID=UPI001F12C45F|nr:uncharacterized protein LOC124531961 [Vanessa cardui]